LSLFPIGLTLLQAAVLDLLNPVFFLPRNIGGFVADVTMEEQHSDELVITEHPVEQGAAITDHAFKKPSTLVVRVGYSNSSRQANGNPNYVQDVYDDFLALQASRVPFDIVTGKRIYQNMLIERLSCTTDEKTEYALFLSVNCREIIIANTQVVTVPPASAQTSPEVTNGTQNLGQLNPQPAPNFNVRGPR
jgi:hypothetical protein